ncbi:MAG TPA: hypothetical protein VKD71_06740 [Gemmataceae bacterium]|nr:hypothetical protein [Gemmataceae bacterium]
MTRRLQFIGLIWLGGMAVCAAGCGQSPPREVVAVPAIADPLESAKPDPIPAKAAPAPSTDGGVFPFPDDAGGKALAKSLAPTTPPPMPVADRVGPRERRLPAFLDGPLPAPPTAAGNVPRLPIPAGKEIRPVALAERVPPALGGGIPRLPERAELPTGSLVRQEGRDIAKSAELPILSNRPVPDRAPLTDPTLEFTAQSVITLNLPLRSVQIGFLRIPLPDPFEHTDAARPRTPVVENPNRSLGNPPPPRQ